MRRKDGRRSLARGIVEVGRLHRELMRLGGFSFSLLVLGAFLGLVDQAVTITKVGWGTQVEILEGRSAAFLSCSFQTQLHFFDHFCHNTSSIERRGPKLFFCVTLLAGFTSTASNIQIGSTAKHWPRHQHASQYFPASISEKSTCLIAIPRTPSPTAHYPSTDPLVPSLPPSQTCTPVPTSTPATRTRCS